jgi:lysozyme family protein
METRFDRAVALVLKKEGGYQKHKNDSGNYNSRKELVGTNHGIAAPTYERYLKRPPTEQDMREMSLETAKDIYHALYWLPIRADQIECEGLAIQVFDWHVNAGATAIRAIQSMTGVTKDGKIGPVTIQAINNLCRAKGCDEVNSEYRAVREAFYRNLVTRRPSLRVFLTGWLRRTQQVYEYVKGLALRLFAVFTLLFVCSLTEAQVPRYLTVDPHEDYSYENIERTDILYTQLSKKGKRSSSMDGGYLEMREGFLILSAHGKTSVYKVVKDSVATHVRQISLTEKLDFDTRKDPQKFLTQLVIFYSRGKFDRAKLVIRRNEFIDIVF